MARLVVVTHEFDRFAMWRKKWPPRSSNYLLFDVLVELKKLGHSWRATTGPNPLHGDMALLHVNSTVVEEKYLALRSCYPRTMNFDTADISKRSISRLRLVKGDDWQGPVIVKGNLNSQGSMEGKHNMRAREAGRPLPHPHLPPAAPYEVFQRLADMDDDVWGNPHLVVERFLPEIEEDGSYVVRSWIFMGSRERCTKLVAPDPIVKAGIAIRHGPTEVPEDLRAERERLKFDFGKFDFVIHEGKPILIDANRTPGIAHTILPMMKAGARNLAEGLDEILRGGA